MEVRIVTGVVIFCSFRLVSMMKELQDWFCYLTGGQQCLFPIFWSKSILFICCFATFLQLFVAQVVQLLMKEGYSLEKGCYACICSSVGISYFKHSYLLTAVFPVILDKTLFEWLDFITAT